MFSVINPYECPAMSDQNWHFASLTHIKWPYIKEKGQSRDCTHGEEDKNTESKYNAFLHKCGML